MSDHWSDYIEITGGSEAERAQIEQDLETLWTKSDEMREHIRNLPSVNEGRRAEGSQNMDASYKTQVVILPEGEDPPEFGGKTSRTCFDPNKNTVYVAPDEIDAMTYDGDADGQGEPVPMTTIRMIGHELLHAADPNASAVGAMKIQQQTLIKVLTTDTNVTLDDRLSGNIPLGSFHFNSLLTQLKESDPEFFEVAQAHLERLENIDFSDAETVARQLQEIADSIRDKTSDEFADKLFGIVNPLYERAYQDIIEETVVDAMDRILDELFGIEHPDRVHYDNGDIGIVNTFQTQEFFKPN